MAIANGEVRSEQRDSELLLKKLQGIKTRLQSFLEINPPLKQNFEQEVSNALLTLSEKILNSLNAAINGAESQIRATSSDESPETLETLASSFITTYEFLVRQNFKKQNN